MQKYLIKCLTKGVSEMAKRSNDLRDFYESRVWKSHRIGNPYEVVRFQNILDFLGTKSGNTVLDAGCGGGDLHSYSGKGTVADCSRCLF